LPFEVPIVGSVALVAPNLIRPHPLPSRKWGKIHRLLADSAIDG
jgi:hypothetical protein